AYYFLGTYTERLKDEISREGSQYPPALRMEVDALLDSKSLVCGAIEAVERKRIALDERIREAKDGRELVRHLVARKTALSSLINAVEKQYPYELNSQKPLGEFLSQIPESERLWEL